mgnify:CR=1 FL=1
MLRRPEGYKGTACFDNETWNLLRPQSAILWEVLDDSIHDPH